MNYTGRGQEWCWDVQGCKRVEMDYIVKGWEWCLVRRGQRWITQERIEMDFTRLPRTGVSLHYKMCFFSQIPKSYLKVAFLQDMKCSLYLNKTLLFVMTHDISHINCWMFCMTFWIGKRFCCMCCMTFWIVSKIQKCYFLLEHRISEQIFSVLLIPLYQKPQRCAILSWSHWLLK